jgi:hypothetical protein
MSTEDTLISVLDTRLSCFRTLFGLKDLIIFNDNEDSNIMLDIMKVNAWEFLLECVQPFELQVI